VKRIVVDTSIVLAFYLPAEPYKDRAMALLADHAAGSVQLETPALTMYEILNVLSRCVRGLKPAGTLSPDQATAILAAIDELELGVHDISPSRQRVLDLAVTHSRTAYDAAFLALAEALDADFVTGDERLWRGVQGWAGRMTWVGEYGMA
jgi:predicted nucleic acid-binding protein